MRKPLPKRLSTLIRTARKKKDLTATDIAFYLGVSPQYICNFENGHAKLSPRYFKTLAALLEVSTDDMVNNYLADESERLHHYV